MTLTETRDDVIITYSEVIPEDRQQAEFWTYSGDCENYATLEYKDRTVHICRNGEMRISVPAEDWDNPENWLEHEINVCRYTDELERFVKTDNELFDLVDLWRERDIEIYQNNPWWEAYNDDVLPDGEVFGGFYEAVDFAIEFIRNDENWEN